MVIFEFTWVMLTNFKLDIACNILIVSMTEQIELIVYQYT